MGRAAPISRLVDAIRRGLERLGMRSAPYRPEKHYMRGAGPKSKAVRAAGKDHPPGRA